VIVAIVGSGLIGSSLLRAIHVNDPAVRTRVLDANPEHVRQLAAVAPGVEASEGIEDIASGADLVFICTPVKAIADIVCTLIPLVSSDCVLTDVGSAKASIIAKVRARFPDFTRFVPGHPMAGGEAAGPLHGTAELFRNRRWMLTPYEGVDEGAVERVAAFVGGLGAKVSRMTPERHDEVTALVSHLPHLYAFALMGAVGEQTRALGTDVLDYAGGGFRDVTRIAAADARMWLDIFEENEPFLTRSYELVKTHMEGLLEAIRRRDAEGVTAILNASRRLRLDMNGDIQP
jgi:cyclohexadieny/prephenate dehydrogenase